MGGAKAPPDFEIGGSVINFELHTNFNKNSSALVIGVDIDGVLADFNSAFIGKVNKKFGTDWKTHDVREYSYQNCIGLSFDEVEGVFSEMKDDDSYAELTKMPMADLINFLPGRVQLVTNREPILKLKTLDWLERHGIYNYENLLFIEGNKSKSSEVLGLEFDYFIEDSLKNALDMSTCCKKVFLIDHPYNNSAILPENIVRVDGWRSILNVFIDSLELRK